MPNVQAGDQMKNAISLSMAVALAACGPSNSPPKQNRVLSSSVSARGDLQNETAHTASVTASKPVEPGYEQAIKCWALADVVDTLVNADVIKEHAIASYSGRMKGSWQDRAVVLGGMGLGASQVHDEFEQRQLELLAPLQSLSQSDAAEHIEAMVRESGDCAT